MLPKYLNPLGPKFTFTDLPCDFNPTQGYKPPFKSWNAIPFKSWSAIPKKFGCKLSKSPFTSKT